MTRLTIEQIRAENEILRRALRSVWVIEDRGEICVVVTDKGGVPFRSRTAPIVWPLWRAWERQRARIVGEDSPLDADYGRNVTNEDRYPG